MSGLPGAQWFTTWDGIRIAYQEWGDAGSPPVVLHHGFVANADANWLLTGVVDALLAAGHRVIAPDARGHGASDKPHDPVSYGEHLMARDLAVLLEIVQAPQVDLVGYSMGAVVSLIYAGEHERVRRLIVGGVGAGIIECGGVDRRVVTNQSIIETLEIEDPSELPEDGARSYRALADALGADRKAMLAQARAVYRGHIALERITAATLVLAGDRDPLAVRPETLAEAIPGATLLMLSGDHIATLGNPRFAQSIVEFLA